MKIDIEKLICFLMSDEVIENNIPESLKLGLKEQGYKYEDGKICPLQEEPVSEDLGEYINELSKQFPEVSFAKLSRIAVRVAKWQKEQINEALLSEVLPCFMHGGEADEVVAKLDEVLNQKKKED